jgi:hypothetical protein
MSSVCGALPLPLPAASDGFSGLPPVRSASPSIGALGVRSRFVLFAAGVRLQADDLVDGRDGRDGMAAWRVGSSSMRAPC